ncbi:hypothetical protein ACFSHP_24915 [Novosphingobium panipatense]
MAEEGASRRMVLGGSAAAGFAMAASPVFGQQPAAGARALPPG